MFSGYAGVVVGDPLVSFRGCGGFLLCLGWLFGLSMLPFIITVLTFLGSHRYLLFYIIYLLYYYIIISIN